MPETDDKKKIEFFVNNREFFSPQEEIEGAQIKDLAKVPLDYELYIVRGDKSERIADNQVVHIHAGEHFRAIPAGTFGTNAAAS